MKLDLRRATPIDAPALAEVHVSSWREAYVDIVPESHFRGFTVERRAKSFQEALASGAEETYVVEHSGQIVGFLTLGSCRDSDIDPYTTGEIWGIYVSPAYWHKGIGRYLCERGEAILSSRGYSWVTLWVLQANEQAKAFYKAMRFESDGALKQVNLDTSQDVVRYRKGLDKSKTVSAKAIQLA